jgi:N-acetyl-anhydromuramyl-L-alanine amidase AmpD
VKPPPNPVQEPPPSGICAVTADVLACSEPLRVSQLDPPPEGRGPIKQVQGIVLHHTSGPPTGNAPSLTVVARGRPGVPGPYAHILIGRDGSVFQILSLRQRVYHVGLAMPWNRLMLTNSNTISVELEHSGTGEPWPREQMEAAVAVVRALMAAYGTNAVVGHKEVARPRGRKNDPAFDMDLFRAEVGRTEAMAQ